MSRLTSNANQYQDVATSVTSTSLSTYASTPSPAAVTSWRSRRPILIISAATINYGVEGLLGAEVASTLEASGAYLDEAVDRN